MVNITTTDLTKEFGKIVAVNGVDLTIEDGEFVTLVGPSGCGKTTTLRMIAGLETPTSGTISFGDSDVTNLPPQQRDAAFLFQDVALFPHMSVIENITYGLKLEGMERDERERRAEEVAEELQIAQLLESQPNNLSGGQRQRVALARAMVREPTIFLFDEPMSDLDAKLKRELRPLFQEVAAETGCPTLYVTHDQEEAMTMSDRIVVMNDGEVAQQGTPEEVYQYPASEFVGKFIGQPTMEFFDGEVTDAGDPLALLVEGTTFEVPAEDAPSLASGDSVRVGVRPQSIEVRDAGEQGVPAEHVLDEPMGDKTYSIFDTDVGRVTAVTPAGFHGEREQYSLYLTPAAMKFFDATTGSRLAAEQATPTAD